MEQGLNYCKELSIFYLCVSVGFPHPEEFPVPGRSPMPRNSFDHPIICSRRTNDSYTMSADTGPGHGHDLLHGDGLGIRAGSARFHRRSDPECPDGPAADVLPRGRHRDERILRFLPQEHSRAQSAGRLPRRGAERLREGRPRPDGQHVRAPDPPAERGAVLRHRDRELRRGKRGHEPLRGVSPLGPGHLRLPRARPVEPEAGLPELHGHQHCRRHARHGRPGPEALPRGAEHRVRGGRHLAVREDHERDHGQVQAALSQAGLLLAPRHDRQARDPAPPGQALPRDSDPLLPQP